MNLINGAEGEGERARERERERERERRELHPEIRGVEWGTVWRLFCLIIIISTGKGESQLSTIGMDSLHLPHTQCHN